MEKYAQYREHILHEERFLTNLDEQMEQVKEYTKKINEISPNILNNELNFNDDLQIANLYSSQKFDIKQFEQLKDYINTFNADKCQQLIDQTNNFINELENNPLFDPQGQISEVWLKTLKDYNEISEINNQVAQNETDLIKFQTQSNVLTEKLQASVKASQKDQSLVLNENLVERFVPTKKMHNLKKGYLITIGVLLGIIVILLVLIIVGVLLTW